MIMMVLYNKFTQEPKKCTQQYGDLSGGDFSWELCVRWKYVAKWVYRVQPLLGDVMYVAEYYMFKSILWQRFCASIYSTALLTQDFYMGIYFISCKGETD